MVGEMVFFRLDKKVQRPLLVVRESSELVTGILFLDWESDRVTPWVRERCFFSGSSGPTHMMVYDIPRGHEIGEWQEKYKEKK